MSRFRSVLMAILDTDAGSALNSLKYIRIQHSDEPEHVQEVLGHALRRLFFPFAPILICVVLALLGHSGSRFCLDGLVGSSPTWYWISFLVVAYPFASLYPGAFRPAGLSRELILGLGSVALGIGVFEATLSELLDRDTAWAAGFSLFTLVGLVAVPSFFWMELDPAECEEQNANDSLGSTLAVAATIISVVLSLASSWGYTAGQGRGKIRIDQSAQDDWWKSLVVYTLLPAQAVVLFADRHRKIRFSFAYCLFFAVLGTRVPDFLSFGSVRLFTLLGREADQRFDHRYAFLSRYGVSLGFLMSMTLYMHLLRRVVASMAAPNLYPRFLFHAQLYYYACYYLLVSASREMDVLFWTMVVSMNVYYVVTNTGVADDVVRYAFSRRCRQTGAPGSPSVARAKDAEDLLALVYRIKLADQDSLADVTALWAVPSLLTAFAQLAARDALSVAGELQRAQNLTVVPVTVKVEHYNGAALDLSNLWLRFGIMFVARLVSSRASRAVFAFKIRRERRSLLDRVQDPEMLTDAAQRAWLKRLGAPNWFSQSSPRRADATADSKSSSDLFEVVVDREFWQVYLYFVLVAVHAMFSLFQNPNLPGRYTFCSFVTIE